MSPLFVAMPIMCLMSNIFLHIFFLRRDRSGTRRMSEDTFFSQHPFPFTHPFPPQGGFGAINFTYDTGRKIILHSVTDSVPQVTNRPFVRQFSPSVRAGCVNVLPKKHVSNRNFQMQASFPPRARHGPGGVPPSVPDHRRHLRSGRGRDGG